MNGTICTMQIIPVKLIVLSGDAGAGKDAVAKELVETRGWRLHSLAGPMKRFAADMFGFTDEQLYGPSKARNEPDPRWARPCRQCAGTGSYNKDWVEHSDVKCDVPCDECNTSGVINDNSPRRILQLMGEEFLRQQIHPDVLTIRACPEIETLLAAGHGVVVNDARNDNDRANLHSWLGGHRVDVRTSRVRPITPESAWRLHASEQRKAQDDQVEYVIQQGDERWPFPSLAAKVTVMLTNLGIEK